jgi:hypothetical protein
MTVEGAPLPTAQGAYRGVDLCAVADQRGKLGRFSHASTAPNAGALHIRFKLTGFSAQYVLHPQCVKVAEGSFGVVLSIRNLPIDRETITLARGMWIGSIRMQRDSAGSLRRFTASRVTSDPTRLVSQA